MKKLTFSGLILELGDHPGHVTMNGFPRVVGCQKWKRKAFLWVVGGQKWICTCTEHTQDFQSEFTQLV